MFSLLTMLEARIAYSHKNAYIFIHNKLNIMSYNSACIELLRSLLFTLYIHSQCASRRAELARGQGRWVVLYQRLVLTSWAEQFEAINTDDANLSYERFCDILKRNMSNHLSSKRVRVDGCGWSYRHTPKPWWTTRLTELWDTRCIAYHLYCSNSTADKRENHEQLKVAQYTFDWL